MDSAKSAFDYSLRITEIVERLHSKDKGFPLCYGVSKCGVSAVDGAGSFRTFRL